MGLEDTHSSTNLGSWSSVLGNSGHLWSFQKHFFKMVLLPHLLVYLVLTFPEGSLCGPHSAILGFVKITSLNNVIQCSESSIYHCTIGGEFGGSKRVQNKWS